MYKNTFCLYRLEYSDGKEYANRKRIKIINENGMQIISFYDANKENNKRVYLSDFVHHKYYISKHRGKLGNAHNKKQKFSMESYRMYYPLWIKELLFSFILSEGEVNNKDILLDKFEKYMKDNELDIVQLMSIKRNKPNYVDQTTPGISYSLPVSWMELLELTCVCCECNNISIKNYDDIISKKDEPYVRDESIELIRKNTTLDFSNDNCSNVLAKCVLGPVKIKYNEPKEGINVLFNIMDKNGIKINKEKIIEIYNEEFKRKQNFSELNEGNIYDV